MSRAHGSKREKKFPGGDLTIGVEEEFLTPSSEAGFGIG